MYQNELWLQHLQTDFVLFCCQTEDSCFVFMTVVAGMEWTGDG